jgi:hypothetical protein
MVDSVTPTYRVIMIMVGTVGALMAGTLGIKR